MNILLSLAFCLYAAVAISTADPLILSPTNLTPSVDGRVVTLSWTDTSDNEFGFMVERSLVDTIWTVVVVLPSNAASYVDVAPLGSHVCYRVRAFNMAASDYSNAACIDTVPPPVFTTVPPAPTNVNLDKNMVLTWDPIPGAVGYHVLCAARPVDSLSPEKGGETVNVTLHINRIAYSTNPAWRASCGVIAWNQFGPSPLSNIAKVPQ